MFDRISRLMIGAKKGDIEKRLKKAGISYMDSTDDCGYPNFRIAQADGSSTQVYWNAFRKEAAVQHWTPVKMIWSGIPVFDPGDKKLHRR